MCFVVSHNMIGRFGREHSKTDHSLDHRSADIVAVRSKSSAAPPTGCTDGLIPLIIELSGALKSQSRDHMAEVKHVRGN